MEFADKLVEVLGAGILVAFEGQQLLEAGRALLEDAAIGAFLDVTAQLARLGLGQSAVGEIVEDALYLFTVHGPG